MNKFPWNCGECPLLQSYDLSVDDLTYVCLWSKAQIDDCDRYKSAQCPLEEHDAKVRAEAIDKFLDLFADEITEAEHIIETDEIPGDTYGLTSTEICGCIESAKEQLKEIKT